MNIFSTLTFRLFNRGNPDDQSPKSGIREIIYTDQQLLELTFSDHETVSFYPEIPMFSCTCDKMQETDTTKTCKHVKATQKCKKKYNYLVKQMKEFVDNTATIEESPFHDFEREECPICFAFFDKISKYVKCGTCKIKVHKACMKRWQSEKVQTITYSIVKPKYTNFNKCISCLQNLGDVVYDNDNKPL